MSHDLRTLPKRFGKAVREARKAAGLSQEKLAEKADLTLNFVGEVERGEKLASIKTAAQLAVGLGMTAAELMKRAGL